MQNPAAVGIIGRVSRQRRRAALGPLALLALGAVTGCGVTIPTDPDGTLDRSRGGVIRVGVSANPPWTELPQGTDTEQPAGIEPELVTAFAESLDAEVEWTAGGEEALARQLEEGLLDVVVGGFTATTPWSRHAALTVPYVEVVGPDGKPEPHVMATAMGENAFLVELERFLLERDIAEVAP
jgi:ABC-type amino acid transport substrate-binding protein